MHVCMYKLGLSAASLRATLPRVPLGLGHLSHASDIDTLFGGSGFAPSTSVVYVCLCYMKIVYVYIYIYVYVCTDLYLDGYVYIYM